MMLLLWQILGVLITIIAFVDVYLTVLYPRTGKSVVSLKLSKLLWEVFRWISRTTGSKNILTYCGPTLLVAIALLWICLFTFGFALLIWPALGNGIQAGSGKTPTDFGTALYYSGFSLTTLGVGDLVPKTTFWRLVTIVEAAVGFSVFTATLTYLLSVYNSLTRRNVFALSLCHRAGCKANAADLLSGFKGFGKFELAAQDISNIARDLLFMLESHHAYPILHYFRFQAPHYSLARIALISLDLATLIKTALRDPTYQSLISSAAVKELESGGLNLLYQLSDSFLDSAKETDVSEKTAWRQWYFNATGILQHNGIETVLDRETGADNYVAERNRWNKQVSAFARYMDFSWGEIAPDEQKR